MGSRVAQLCALLYPPRVGLWGGFEARAGAPATGSMDSTEWDRERRITRMTASKTQRISAGRTKRRRDSEREPAAVE